MHIVPVIDLMHGYVVQAVRGQRQHYQPLRSTLTPSHQLLDVVAAILQVYPFTRLYIADLNAILGDPVFPNHQTVIALAMQAFPHIEWWVDAGINDMAGLHSWQALGARVILASESQANSDAYLQLRADAPHAVCSLDYFADGFRGPIALQDQPALWTPSTILMSLAKVGAQAGPDFGLLEAHQTMQTHGHAATPRIDFYMAGGIRHLNDLRTLHSMGAAGVLIASALHHGQLDHDAIASIVTASCGK